ncbi:Myb-like DNA-binding domain containing protein [Tritrichomonas foetus]|uniref:Myb-like DNA-binding domain containing protein n=1 Tax=Tritrichomonas foetus TaxID=1144522 RepID=A0A1J4KWW3_9EUKA|nr:Myb-like DNA-binding domain containing protein [Tritrichomonas foetus]|eukprot:OHT15658.1 Myb-like DNA-binding domain containing protein [Tritrichomonas foetus]
MTTNQPTGGHQPKREQKPHPKSKFTSEEDAKLKQLVNQFGVNSWNQISQNMVHRNPRQCKERWFNYLSPMIRKTPWSTEEDELLERKVNEIGPKWVKIAKFFPMRTDIHIKNRWLVLSRKKTREALQNRLTNIIYTDDADSSSKTKQLSKEVPNINNNNNTITTTTSNNNSITNNININNISTNINQILDPISIVCKPRNIISPHPLSSTPKPTVTPLPSIHQLPDIPFFPSSQLPTKTFLTTLDSPQLLAPLLPPTSKEKQEKK